MKALLLAAGLGTRLRPLTDTVPKCLVPIHDKPLLEYWLEMLTEADVEPLLINLNYMADKVLDYIDASRFRGVVTTVYEETLLGTAGTLLKNRLFFGDEPLMLIHADNLSSFDVQAFIRCHQERPKECEITMMTFVTDDPSSCGIVELDERDVVVGFHEKVSAPPSNLANGAVYIIEPSIFDYLASLKQEAIDFSTEVIPMYIGKISTYLNNCYHRDIGTIESYEAAQRDFQAQELRKGN